MAGQRKIEIESFASSFAPLVRKSEKMRKRKRWVSVDGYEQHIVSRIEDRLRSVAVMVIEIEDGRPQTAVRKPLRGDGDVVEIAVAAEHVGARVMARRPRQRERPTLVLRDGLRRR